MPTYHNMYTTIFSQIDDGSTALTVFTSIDQAKSFFFTTSALAVIDTHTSRVEYQLVADANGDNTKLKKTEGFDTSGIGDTYNTQKDALLSSNNWGNRGYIDETSTDHLF
jgi:hypothetical protein